MKWNSDASIVLIVASTLLALTAIPAYPQKKSSPSVGDQWLQFRGPNGSGIAVGAAALPVVFGPTKNLLWKTAVPFARSSPIVTRDRIFLTASENEKLLTFSLDRKTGKVVWRREIVRPRHMSIYRLNDPASPSPVSDGKNVFVFFAELGLIAYDQNGRERWRVPLGPFNSFYGMGGSPVLTGNTLVMVCDQRTNSFVVAVDSRNGKVLWKKDRTNQEAYSTPVVYKPPTGLAQILVLGSQTLDAYSVETGERLWWVTQVGTYPKGVPVLGTNMVYALGSGSDEPFLPPFEVTLKQFDTNKDNRVHREEIKSNAEAYEHFGWIDANNDGYVDRSEYDFIRTTTATGHGVTAIRLEGLGRGDITPSNVAWRVKKNYPNVPALLLYEGVLYLMKDGGIISSVDPVRGEFLKTDRTKDALEEYYASPVAGDGKVFLLSASGKVTVLKAGAQWEILAVNDLGEESWATPAIAGDSIYIRTRNTLYAFHEGTR